MINKHFTDEQIINAMVAYNEGGLVSDIVLEYGFTRKTQIYQLARKLNLHRKRTVRDYDSLRREVIARSSK